MALGIMLIGFLFFSRLCKPAAKVGTAVNSFAAVKSKTLCRWRYHQYVFADCDFLL